MNAALKYQQPMDTYESIEEFRPENKHWAKVLFTVLGAAFLTMLVAVASVSLRLSIDQKFQKIDEVKIRNAQLENEIDKLEARVSSLKSLERVQGDLNKAGIEMDLPRAVFFIDPSKGDGYLAMNGKQGGSI